MPMIFIASDFKGADDWIEHAGLLNWKRQSKIRKDSIHSYCGASVMPVDFYGPTFLNLHETHQIDYSFGPLVSNRGDWRRFSKLYTDLHIRCGTAAIVRVQDPLLVKEVPARFQVSLEYGPLFNPWGAVGRGVWVQGTRTIREAWQQYCEYRTIGVEVIGVLLPSFSYTFTQRKIVAGDMRVRRSNWDEGTERFRQSLNNVRDFWKAVTMLYDGKARGEICSQEEEG